MTGEPCFQDFYLGDGSRLQAAWEMLWKINEHPNRDKHISDGVLGYHWLKDYRDNGIPAASFLTLLERYPEAAGSGLYDLIVDNREHVCAVLDLLKSEHLEVLKQHHWEAARELGTKLAPRVSGEMREEMMAKQEELTKSGARIIWAELRDYVMIVFDLDGKLQGLTFGLDWEKGEPIWTEDNPSPYHLARFCRQYDGKTALDPDDMLDEVYPDFFRFELIPTLWPLAIRDACRKASPRDALLFLTEDDQGSSAWAFEQVLRSPVGRRLRRLSRRDWAELMADEYGPVRAMAIRVYGHLRIQTQTPITKARSR